MKVILYMAVSADGLIATAGGDSDWVSEADTDFGRIIREVGCLVVGKRTFDQYQGDLYPMEGVINIVLTSSKVKGSDKNVLYVGSPSEAIAVAQKRELSSLVLIGGGRTNGSFLKENLIDEIYLSVHPLVLGEGIKLFEGVAKAVKLELLGKKDLFEGLVQLHYRVIKG